jgi:hypothetical protein
LRRYIVEHWRGELSLAQSFWINWLVVYLGLVAVFLGIGPRLGAAISPIFVVAVAVVFLTHICWAVVGVTRSAFRTVRAPKSTFLGKAFGGAAIAVMAMVGYFTIGDIVLLLR